MLYDDLLKLNKEVVERFDNLERRLRKNEVISGFYEGIHYLLCANDDYFTGIPSLDRKLGRYLTHVRKNVDKVLNCTRWFDVDYYPFQGVKDLKRTFACHNKFCDGCQSALSQKRYERFTPLIDSLQDTYDVAHVVLTVPNCQPVKLAETLDRMYQARNKFIHFLQGYKKIRSIDFLHYGFCGGISALEVSRNEKDGTFHPHFHCCFVFKKKSGIFSKRHLVVNSFSFNNAHYKSTKGDNVRMFNDFEILLQKVWRLCFDGKEVNRHNIASLTEGYSVIVERRENFHEVFKYATKGVLRYDKDIGRVLGSYSSFVHLDAALYDRRMIQTYGIFRGIPVPENVDQDEMDDRYRSIIERLQFLETPIEQRDYLESILEEQRELKNIKYISRHNIASLIGDNNDI